MFDTKGEDRGRVVRPHAGFGCVEADALTDDGGFGAVVAPYGEGHLEPHDLLTIGAYTGRSLAVQGVAGCDALVLRGHVPAHVEALHPGGWEGPNC